MTTYHRNSYRDKQNARSAAENKYLVLSCLRERPNVSVREICAALHIAQQTVNTVLILLEMEGIIAVERGIRGQRTKIEVTEAGQVRVIEQQQRNLPVPPRTPRRRSVDSCVNPLHGLSYEERLTAIEHAAIAAGTCYNMAQTAPEP
jgi:DNA-binding MarR family transcriptional regulator